MCVGVMSPMWLSEGQDCRGRCGRQRGAVVAEQGAEQGTEQGKPNMFALGHVAREAAGGSRTRSLMLRTWS